MQNNAWSEFVQQNQNIHISELKAKYTFSTNDISSNTSYLRLFSRTRLVDVHYFM